MLLMPTFPGKEASGIFEFIPKTTGVIYLYLLTTGLK